MFGFENSSKKETTYTRKCNLFFATRLCLETLKTKFGLTHFNVKDKYSMFGKTLSI